MASEPERPAADEDTAALEQNGRQAPDGAWPVSDLYYVAPYGEAEGPAREPRVEPAPATVVQTQQPAAVPARRLPPNRALAAALAVLALAGALLLAFVLIGADGDDPAATAQAPTGGATTSPPPGETTTAPTARGRVDVADVEGMSLPEARRALEQQGLQVRVTRAPSDRPRGEILEQEPPAGAEVAKSTIVALVASSGSGAGDTTPAPELVDVPGVIGLSTSDAVARLRDAGLEARVRQVASRERRGTVVDQDPDEGTEVATDSTVIVEVAKPPPVTVQRVRVPDVVGSTASAARSQLRAAGLAVATVAVVAKEAPGTVLSQSPQAGAEVRKGSRVRLRVSSGPAEIAVPDVIGLDEASARRELEAAGFGVRVTDESVTDPAEDGVVLRQTPPGGSSAEDGAVVTIVVGRVG